MRITTLSAAIALVLVSVSTSVQGQRPDDEIDARSVQLLQQGKAARAGGKLDMAVDLVETALVVDPRNRDAFIELGELAQARDLPGKAIRLYREALLLEPNDLGALKGQGEALVQKGAVEKARENLVKIRELCAKSCGDATELAAVIAKGPPVTTAEQTVKPEPDAQLTTTP